MAPPVFSFYPSHERNSFEFSSQHSHLSPSSVSSHFQVAISRTGSHNGSATRNVTNMNMYEQAEFSSPHPSVHMSFPQSARTGSDLQAPLPSLSSPSASPSQYSWSTDQIPTFERDFCSDFTCCGLALNDLHELIDHFEESHVLVVDADGNPLYPARRSPPLPVSPETLVGDHVDGQSGGFAPYSSLVLGYPHPSSDSPSSDAPSSLTPPIVPSHAPDLRRSLSTNVSSSPSSVSPEHLCLPPSSFSTPSPSNPRPNSTASITSTQKKRSHAHTHTHPHASRKRDRVYKCPRQDCTKTYLNPNGLKYHLEKGTCKIEPNFTRDVLSVQ